MTRRGRPTYGQPVRSRIIRLKASNPSLTIDAVHGQLEEEGLEVGRSFVGNVIKRWNSLDEEIKWRDLPFEWRQLERADVPWESSRCLMDYQQYLLMNPQLTLSGRVGLGQGYLQNRYSLGPQILRKLGTDDSFEKDSYEQRRISSPEDPFTNRWACWCWRVHLAAPKFGPGLVLPIARIYAAAEQMTELVPDVPKIDLAWLDACLRVLGEVGEDRRDPLHQSGGYTDTLSQLADLIRSKDQAANMAFEHPDVDQQRAFGVNSAFESIYDWINTRQKARQQNKGQGKYNDLTDFVHAWHRRVFVSFQIVRS